MNKNWEEKYGWSKLDTVQKISIACENARAIKMSNGNYFDITVAQRDPFSGSACGSRYYTEFLGNGATALDAKLFVLNVDQWQPYPECPNLAPGCEAYILRTDIDQGFVGVVKLSDLPDNKMLTVDDRKNTGLLSVVADGELKKTSVNFSVAIIGDEGGEPTLFTFHPGDPTPPSDVRPGDAHTYKHGDIIAVKNALGLGLEYAKIK